MAMQQYWSGSKIQGTEFKYTSDAIDWASNNDHVVVLEWFKNSAYRI